MEAVCEQDLFNCVPISDARLSSCVPISAARLSCWVVLSTEEQITGNQDVTLKKEKGRGEKVEENIDERGDLYTQLSHWTCDSVVSASFLDISRKEACASR